MSHETDGPYFPRELREQLDAIRESLAGSAPARRSLADRASEVDRVLIVSSGDSFFLGHAVVVARPKTEDAVALADAVRSRVEVPVLIGGYSNHENVSRLLQHASGAIVGGTFKKDTGQEGVDPKRARSYVRLARTR